MRRAYNHKRSLFPTPYLGCRVRWTTSAPNNKLETHLIKIRLVNFICFKQLIHSNGHLVVDVPFIYIPFNKVGF